MGSKSIILLLTCLFLEFHVVAQQYFQHHYPVVKNNRQLKLNTAFQDSRGYICVGTEDGLYSMHDKQVKEFPGLKGAITAIAEDAYKRVWIGQESGEIGHILQGKYTRFDPEEGLPGVAITAIAFDKGGNPWFATYGEGIYTMYNNRLYNFDMDDGLPDNHVYTLAVSNDEILAGSDAGLSIVSFRDREKSIRNYSTRDGLPDHIVKTIWKLNDDEFLLGMDENGIAGFHLPSSEFTVVKPGWNQGSVSSIYSNNNEIWMATSKGIFCYDIHGENTRRIPSAPDQKTFQLFEDREGNIWYINRQGLFSFQKSFTFFDSQAKYPLTAIHAGAENVWYSSNHQLFLLHEAKPIFTAPAKVQIISIYEDKHGWLWLGTFGQGIMRYHPVTKKIIYLDESHGLSNNNVLSITGNGDEIWFATLGGASSGRLNTGGKNFLFNPSKGKSGIGSYYIYQVFIDSKNRVWLTTDGQGVFVKENEMFRQISTPEGLSETIYSIAEDKSGNIWLSSANEGLFVINNTGIINLPREKFNSITALSPAGNGIMAIKEGSVLLISDTSGSYLEYGPENGIEIKDQYLNLISTGRDGNIWFNSGKNIAGFYPSAFQYEARPEIILRDVLIYLEDIDTLHSTFRHDQNHFTFLFDGIWHTNPGRLKYQYRLEGYDDNWISTADRSATFANLQPGKYLFQVRVALDDDFSNAAYSSYSFSISTPFWFTWWFMLSVIAAGGAGFYSLFNLRERQLRRQAERRKEQILFEFETLKSQVNPHFLFNSFNTLISIIEDDKDVAITYVEKLSDFFRSLLQYREKDLITLEEELKLLENYFFLQKKRYRDNLLPVINISQEAKKLMVPPLSLQLLVENAIKHNIISNGQKLKIEIFTAELNYITVRNNLQKKLSKLPSTGIGLQNIKKRYSLLSREDIKITEDNGFFMVSLPLLN